MAWLKRKCELMSSSILPVLTQPGLSQAVLGGGCFWCTEAVMLDLKGVVEVESAYSGGHVVNPTYEQICSARTGHAEVVRVVFDPVQISFENLLKVFFATHDPTTPNRQGNDVGPQYRSVIFATDDAQAATAKAVIEALEREQIFDAPVVTEVSPLINYYAAEAYHQRYFEQHPYQGYCMAVVAPKVAKFRKQFIGQLKR
jgi:peptide-methionine (S)-S-oxide reductase